MDLDDRSLFYIKKADLKEYYQQTENSRIAIPIENIHTLKFRKDKKPLNSTLWGALIGGTGTGVAFAILNELDGGLCGAFCFSNSGAFAIGFVFGSLPGSIFGAIIG